MKELLITSIVSINCKAYKTTGVKIKELKNGEEISFKGKLYVVVATEKEIEKEDIKCFKKLKNGVSDSKYIRINGDVTTELTINKKYLKR
jgi:hypothetical protein